MNVRQLHAFRMLHKPPQKKQSKTKKQHIRIEYVHSVYTAVFAKAVFPELGRLLEPCIL